MPEQPQPQQPVESIVLDQFSGIKNTVSRERLDVKELERATNVDIDDVGQMRRRRGYTKKLSGEVHSLQNIGERVLGVVNGYLGVIGTDYTFTSLGVVAGAERLSYTAVADTIYFSSGAVSGKIVGDTILPWGANGGSGQWVSPVMTPTTTLGEVFGHYIDVPPLATEIEAYNGRIYLAAGCYVWGTELWLLDHVNKTRNFLQFESDVTMIAAMDDGIYFGTDNALWFLKGTLSEGFQRTQVLDRGVIRGSKAVVPATDIHPSARTGPLPEGMAVVFMTSRGVTAGFDGGEVHDLTHGHVEFPNAISAAVTYREDAGTSSYVAVLNSSGGPSANSRIGDYADAEIIRAGE